MAGGKDSRRSAETGILGNSGNPGHSLGSIPEKSTGPCCRKLLSRSNSRASNEHGDGDGGGRGARQGGGGSAREFPRLYYISDLRSGSLGQETVGCVDIAKVALANSPSRSVLPESMLGRSGSVFWYFRCGTSPKTGRSTMDAISLWRMRTPPNLCSDTLLEP